MRYMTLAGPLVAVLMTSAVHAEEEHHAKCMEHHERSAMHKQMHRPGKIPPAYGDVHGRAHHAHEAFMRHHRATLEVMSAEQRQACRDKWPKAKMDHSTRASTTFMDEIITIPAAHPQIEEYFHTLPPAGRKERHR